MKTARNKRWRTWFKVIVSVLALAYLGWKIWEKRAEFPKLWLDGWDAGKFLIVPALLLMLVNYLLEAQKWRVMVREFYPELSLRRAFVAVLAGMAAGSFTPNRIGEYAGRVLFLREGKRVEAVVATFVDRICQLLVTLLAGLAVTGYLLLRDDAAFREVLNSLGGRTLLLLVAAAMLFLLLLFIAMPGPFAKLIPGRASVWLRKIRFGLQRIAPATLRRVFLLSLLRYAVFSTQYLLLMYAFGYGQPHSLLLGYALIVLVFLGKSILPVMGILELGVRESVALLVMSAFGVAEACAVSSTFLLYIINILLPTLLGVAALQRLES